jgi:spore coat polysaccharide biosynthesis protein SpsF
MKATATGGELVEAIIQARMASSRLPGKVLMKVMGRPLLSYQLERLRMCGSIDEIIIATTTNKQDDPIEALADSEKIKCFRGSENDVLDRYYQAAKKYNAKHIIRITADCPLIQPDICDRIIERYFQANLDYAATGPSFAEGLDCEVCSFTAMEKAWQKTQLKSEREHVTLYIRNHPEEFNNSVLENETDDGRYRITVDQKEDFLVVKAVLENLYKEKAKYFTISDIKSFLDAHPEIYNLNAHIVRNEGLLKSLKQDENF